MLTKKDKLKFSILIISLIVVIVIVRSLGLTKLFSPTLIREQVLGYGPIAPIIFIIIYIVSTILFLPATPATIASGLIFGKFLGTLYTVIGATIGATMAFLIARSLGKSFVENFLKNKYKKLHEYDKKIEKNGLLVVLFLRMIPLFPFNGLNFALGLTKLKTRDFIIGTAIGIIPGTFALAFLGDSVTNFSVINIIISLGLFGFLALLPTIYKRIKKKAKI